jgi:hypothetical protein
MDTIKRFDNRPDDAVVPRRVTAAPLHTSDRTVAPLDIAIADSSSTRCP